jgi:hypothetical protein
MSGPAQGPDVSMRLSTCTPLSSIYLLSNLTHAIAVCGLIHRNVAAFSAKTKTSRRSWPFVCINTNRTSRGIYRYVSVQRHAVAFNPHPHSWNNDHPHRSRTLLCPVPRARYVIASLMRDSSASCRREPPETNERCIAHALRSPNLGKSIGFRISATPPRHPVPPLIPRRFNDEMSSSDAVGRLP